MDGDEFQAECFELQTRAKSYNTSPNLLQSPPTSTANSSRASSRYNNYLKCITHCPRSRKGDRWLKENDSCNSCVTFNSGFSEFSNGKLPRNKDIIERLIYIKSQRSGKKDKRGQIDCEREVALDVCLHWIYCNVYPLSVEQVTRKLQSLYSSYSYIRYYDDSRKKETYWKKYDDFVNQLKSLFDIPTAKSHRIKQEQFWKVRMGEDENKFYQNQVLCPPIGYCDSFVSRRDILSQERKRRNVKDKNFDFSSGQLELENSDGDASDIGNHDTFEPPKESTPKKRKYECIVEDAADTLPREYRHIRKSVHGVRPEVYVVMEKLSAVYHMSSSQVQGAIVTVANDLFGRKECGAWKTYDEGEGIDINTLPCPKAVRQTESYMEAMALGMIVNEIMSEDNETVVVYSNDGSALSGLGSYVVQSVTINGNKRSLPTYGIFTESRSSLKDLELSTLEILSACSGYKHTKADIVKNISFVMTDSTEHNLGVIEKVCEELAVEETDIPLTLVCNVHPLMMFQDKVKKLCHVLHTSLGAKKISECFLVDIDFQNESFVVKAMKCLTNFINKDFSAKPWNRYSHFTQFIRPKQNKSITLKDHRFNRLFDCALCVLYHMDDIAEYLDKFSSIVNGISILDRSFAEMEVLKPIFCAISLLGIHITRPFHSLLLDKNTTYTMLKTCFQKLYEEMKETPSTVLLTTTQKLTFVEQDMFNKALPETCLLQYLEDTIQVYPTEISSLISQAKEMMAEGFSHQKGAIFGFGDNADADTGTKLKICTAPKEIMSKLDTHVETHNLGEERNVGMTNYEIMIRGKKNLQSASKKIVLNRSMDLIEKNPTDFKKYKKTANIVKELRKQWDEKMILLQENSFALKEAETTKRAATILKDTEFLKSQNIPGPFTSVEEVEKFMDAQPESTEKNQRMYREVRFHRMTSSRKKESDPVFRLKQSGKNLETIDYANNLKCYLEKTRRLKNISLEDLGSVLNVLHNSNPTNTNNDINVTEKRSECDNFDVGEHVAVFWQEDEGYRWYIGVVSDLSETEDDLIISYFVRATKNGTSWNYPEEAEIRQTKKDQVICRNLKVAYHCYAVIRCSIELKMAKEIDELLAEIIKNL